MQNDSLQDVGFDMGTKEGHISLRQNSTNKSNDGGKGGHSCNYHGISNHLQLIRSVPLVGQLSL